MSTNHTGSVISMAAIDKLLQRWNARFPHPKRDPVSVWDDIVTNRSVQEFRKWTSEVHSAHVHICAVCST